MHIRALQEQEKLPMAMTHGVGSTITKKSCTEQTQAWVPTTLPRPVHLLCRAQDPVLLGLALQAWGVATQCWMLASLWTTHWAG